MRGLFEGLRRADVLGAKTMINEWSANPANGVEMDWVVTLPGQYTMLRLPQYLASLGADRAWVPTIDSAGRPGFNPRCPRQAIAENPATAAAAVDACDFRDLPLKLTYTAYNREESKGPPPPPATLEIGPQPPTARAETYLPKVANVIGFGGNSVLGQPDVDVTANLRQPFGWVEAQLESQSDPKVCQWDPSQDSTSPSAAAVNLTLDCATSATGNAPVIGFAAWSRRLAANSEASYGRIVEHSDTSRALGSNIPLRVDAGEDQFVLAGQQVLLNSTASGADGRIESIQWRQMSGPEVTLSDADTAAQASFTAPAPTGGVRFVDREFEVTARDNRGRVGRDTVRVRVALVLENSREGGKIVVFVGPDRSVDEESTVRLSGVAIATGNADIESETWTQTSGQPTVTLNANQSRADFKAPKLPQNTAKRDLTFKFEVTDNKGGTVNKSVTITVRDINNRAPSMTSPSRVDLKIGDWRVFELTADDGDTTGEPIRFKLGGKDKALFIVDTDNGKRFLHFKTPPQGDTPVCSETSCVITITPSDGINKGNPQTVTITVAPPPPPKRLLNDTGVNFSGYRAVEDDVSNATTCIGISAVGAPQDCDQGRDSMADLAKTGAGAAGFDFTKLGANGEVLAIQNAAYAAGGQESRGTQWSCVRDNHTGLVWEVKTQDNGVHGRARTFSMNGFFTSDANTGTVNQLLQAANSGSGHCGFTDWRVPNLDELHNIVLRKLNIGGAELAIDTDFFPNTMRGWYWSASPVGTGQFRPGIRTIQFRGNVSTTDAFNAHWSNLGGQDSGDQDSNSHFVRLVRGAPALSPASSSRYVINSNGTVTDMVTQLMWQRCEVGTSGANCTRPPFGSETATAESNFGLGWPAALKRAARSTFAGFTDWRVPNINELISLIDYEASTKVNPQAFPSLAASVGGSGSFAYMSSSPVSHRAGIDGNFPTNARNWSINFFGGSLTARGGRPFQDPDDEECVLPELPTGGVNSCYFSRLRVIFVRDVTSVDTTPTLGAPGGLLAIADDSQVRVSWTAVTGATGYRLYYSQSPISATSPGASPGVKKLGLSTSRAPASSNPLTVFELTNEKRYYFRFTAIDADGIESAPSSQTSALPSKYPGRRTIER